MKNKNWSKTKITDLLKIRYPIFQGPFGRGGSTPLLAASVSNAGGLGGFGANEISPDQIGKVASEIRSLTDNPFNLNLWVSTFDQNGDKYEPSKYQKLTASLEPFYAELEIAPPAIAGNANHVARNFRDQVEALLEAKPAVFSFVFGIPDDDVLRRCRKQGIVLAGGASTVNEAIALEQAGVDIVIASGYEAGGHHTAFLQSAEESQIGTFALVPQIADAVKIPVIAAGGIADGRGIAAAMTLGADGVQIGTAFYACDESGASDAQRRLLFSDATKATALTRAFTGRLARGISNDFALEMSKSSEIFAPYPAHSWILAPLREAAVARGRFDLVNLWAGQATPLIKYHKADQLFAALVEETNNIFE